jgi:hypothetical protein
VSKTDSKNQLRISKNAHGHKTIERIEAEFAQSTVLLNAQTVRLFARGTAGVVDLTESLTLLQTKTEQVHSGDLSGPEAILVAQAVALDVIFNEMARRAALNMGEHLQATDTYMRLAMRAQGQCRATVQTLGELKNPRQIAFVKQANIASGHQQVNNHTDTCLHTRTGGFSTNKLSGEGDELLPHARASRAKGRTNQKMEALGTIDRS